ncbi:3-demethylubiquinone-9 3-methyltransferase [Stenotrophomonas pictorum JCM 9942]|uniref:3-demethylubiquinone-9 3-methyltransferase n=1 Tax=Stenotrophomonas pictorum JCM 9942 TaxID=1236960 RepID=A0A0R0AIW2_9GAMM|nr:VOC family protein [Stenotrophomonas pictorum]KRG40531.1 3-demethylubiquinone-9 3-methyltransferase [Stenotrophomonas pictorum JCM 9942]
MRLIPYLGFNGNTGEAMAFYANALGGRVVSEMKYGDVPDDGGMDAEGCDGVTPTPEQVAHGQVEAGGAILMAADGPAANGRGVTTSNADVDSIGEAERVFTTLVAGGQVHRALAETFRAQRWGMLVDRYGQRWMVDCTKPTEAGP